MNIYETVFMARQDLTDAQVKSLTESHTKIITDNGGTVHKTENWGLQTLAYKINKAKKAHYVLLEMEAPAAAVHELERNLGLNEDIVRSLTLRLEEKTETPSPIIRKYDESDEKPKRREAA